MRQKLIMIILSSIVFAPGLAQAQVTVDASKVTCDQYVHSKVSNPMVIAAWMSGYYNAKRNNRMVDLQALEEKVGKLKNYCYDEKNYKVPVMKAAEELFGGRKKQEGRGPQRNASSERSSRGLSATQGCSAPPSKTNPRSPLSQGGASVVDSDRPTPGGTFEERELWAQF